MAKITNINQVQSHINDNKYNALSLKNIKQHGCQFCFVTLSEPLITIDYFTIDYTEAMIIGRTTPIQNSVAFSFYLIALVVAVVVVVKCLSFLLWFLHQPVQSY